MEFEKYNIRLVRITEMNIESLRLWRNSDYVRKQMIYNELITPEMQISWYKKLDKNKNFYFILYSESIPVGVMHIKNIENSRGEGGIFLTDQKFENTDVVARMILCFNDYVFYKLNIECIYSHVKVSNKKAISSSISQGCLRIDSKSNSEVVYFELFPENYEKKVLKIKKILK
jgi:RimJ/RimL family protein N-acetyltransferase